MEDYARIGGASFSVSRRHRSDVLPRNGRPHRLESAPLKEMDDSTHPVQRSTKSSKTRRAPVGAKSVWKYGRFFDDAAEENGFTGCAPEESSSVCQSTVMHLQLR